MQRVVGCYDGVGLDVRLLGVGFDECCYDYCVDIDFCFQVCGEECGVVDFVLYEQCIDWWDVLGVVVVCYCYVLFV